MFNFDLSCANIINIFTQITSHIIVILLVPGCYLTVPGGWRYPPIIIKFSNTLIHSKSESRDPNDPAKKFEISANLTKTATKWPKNGPK